MRTTINLDEDLAERLRDLAHQRRSSFTDAVNEAIRAGLRQQKPASASEPYRTIPWQSAFAPGIDPSRLNQLADELEDEEILRKMGRRR